MRAKREETDYWNKNQHCIQWRRYHWETCSWVVGVRWWWGEAGRPNLSGDLQPLGSLNWTLLLSIKVLTLRLNKYIHSTQHKLMLPKELLWNSLQCQDNSFPMQEAEIQMDIKDAGSQFGAQRLLHENKNTLCKILNIFNFMWQYKSCCYLLALF